MLKPLNFGSSFRYLGRKPRYAAIIYFTAMGDSLNKGRQAGAVGYNSFIQAVLEIATENLEQRSCRLNTGFGGSHEA